MVSRRQGLGAGGGSSDAGSAAAPPPRGGTDGPVFEAGEGEAAGLAEPLSGLVLRLGGGAKLDGSRREERGAETWPSLRRVVCDALVVNEVHAQLSQGDLRLRHGQPGFSRGTVSMEPLEHMLGYTNHLALERLPLIGMPSLFEDILVPRHCEGFTVSWQVL